MKRLLLLLCVLTAVVGCKPDFRRRTARYASVGELRERRAAVLDTVDGAPRWGYVDAEGRLVIPCRYAAAAPFSEGRAAVQIPGERWGYIDTTGLMVIAPEYAVASPFADSLGWFGQVFLSYGFLAYAAIIIAFVCAYVLKRTRFGLQIEATGENPKAARSAGVRVKPVRYFGYMFCGFMAGIAGAFLSCGIVGAYTENMSAGRGFICLAVTILARWNPVLSVLAALLFGTVQALQLRLQAMGSELPYQFFVALPYIVTLLSLMLFGWNIHAPKALGKPYNEEQR